MTRTLQFDIEHAYPFQPSGISVPVSLSLAGRSIDLLAKLDTGASFCIFQREYGEALGIAIEAGFRERVVTAAGWFWAFGHQLTVDTFGIVFDTTVYFAEPAGFSRNVLGRQGWLNRVRLALIDYDGRLYLSPYAS